MSQPPNNSSRIVVGRISRAHGVRGEVRVRVESDSLLDLESVFLDGKRVNIRSARPDRGDLLVVLEGITDRDVAQSLAGKELSVERDELPAPSEDEVYVADLIGCEVFDSAGKRLGAVARTSPIGGQEILEIEGGEHSFSLPFVEPFVVSVDVDARRIVCDPPEGLVNLDDADSERG